MQKIIPLIFLLFAGVACAGPLPDEPHIYVEGSAEIEVTPEQMTITVGLAETRLELAAAKQAVEARSIELIDAVKALGIAPEDLSTTALSVSPEYDYRDGERVLLGTRVYRQAEIILRDLAKYAELMAALVEAEISNTVSTRLEVANEEALLNKALIAAIEDAQQRAETMAQSLGEELGEVYSVSEFDMRGGRRQQSFAVKEVRLAASKEPFKPGLITVSAQVYIVFLIE